MHKRQVILLGLNEIGASESHKPGDVLVAEQRAGHLDWVVMVPSALH